ncbi:MAG: dihydrofolate reductase family protein [Ilumatobacteraceae bacterium]
MTVLLDMAVSLDGCISTPDGQDGGLHDWYFDPTPPSKAVIDELVEGAGALLLGRNAFGSDDDAEGWDDSPYLVPHVVVTHRPPATPTGGRIEFVFAPDVATGVDLAVRAAGDRVVALGGGADVARQCLAAGLVDEIQLHVVPVVLGGPTLFGGIVPTLTLTKLRVVDAPNVTHLHYRVER